MQNRAQCDQIQQVSILIILDQRGNCLLVHNSSVDMVKRLTSAEPSEYDIAIQPGRLIGR